MLWQRKVEKHPTLCCSAFRSCVRSTFSSSSSSALCLTLFMALWYSRSWFWKKKETKLGQQARKHGQKVMLSLPRTATVAIVLLSPWRRAQAMELALRLTSWLRMEGKDISMLCRSSSRSRTQLSHTARGMERSAQGPFPGLPSPLSPGPWDTDLRTSCCLGRLPQGSHTRACRRRTASLSARWSKCTPQCAGCRSPLCTRTLPSLITGKCLWHHFALLPPR